MQYLPKGKKRLYNQLIDLQKAIYELDSILELNWNLDSKQLNKAWNKIYNSLSKLGYTQEDAQKLCLHIKRYEKHECQLRENKSPLRLNLEYFYYYKSCDVRLMRQLIMDRIDRYEGRKIKLTDYRYFDLITEINDDVEDVFEDQTTINANAYLITLFDTPKSRCHEVFNNLIELFVNKSENRLLRQRNKWTIMLNDWTNEVATDTKALLDKRDNEIDISSIKKSSVLYEHWNQ